MISSEFQQPRFKNFVFKTSGQCIFGAGKISHLRFKEGTETFVKKHDHLYGTWGIKWLYHLTFCGFQKEDGAAEKFYYALYMHHN